MGRKSINGGVRPLGPDRIQFDFAFEGVRNRPTLMRAPTEANLRRATQQLKVIKERIANGTFSFAEEFPDYRFKHKIANAPVRRTCNDVFDDFLLHCESRVDKKDFAFVTADAATATYSHRYG